MKRFAVGMAAALIAFAGLLVFAQSANVGIADEIAGYWSWERANVQKSFVESAHPVAKDVYFNHVAAETAHDRSFPHAEGSIYVKETLNAETLEVQVLTLMRKVDGFNPSGGDWQYGRFDRQDDGTYAGSWLDVASSQGCIGCHAGAAATDYTFLTYLD